MQTMQQKRASYALEKVQAHRNESGIVASEYVSYARSLPAMIHMNGLGQAAAFFRMKSSSSSAHGLLYGLLSEWLCREDQPYAGRQDVLEGITQGDMDQYRLAQAEAQALLDWVKKFAKAYMDEEGDA